MRKCTFEAVLGSITAERVGRGNLGAGQNVS